MIYTHRLPAEVGQERPLPYRYGTGFWTGNALGNRKIDETAFHEETKIAGKGYCYKIILHLIELIYADLELENSPGMQVRSTLNYITGLDTGGSGSAKS